MAPAASSAATDGASELWMDYEQDLVALAASLQAKLRDLAAHAGAAAGGDAAWKTVLRSAERELDEGDELVASMDNELFALPPQARAKLQPRMRQYKQEAERARKEFVRFRPSCFASPRLP